MGWGEQHKPVSGRVEGFDEVAGLLRATMTDCVQRTAAALGTELDADQVVQACAETASVAVLGAMGGPVKAAVEDLEREAHAAGIEVGVERERARWAALLEAEAARYPASDDELPVQHYIDGHRDTVTRLRQHVTS